MYEIRGQALVFGYDFKMRLNATADIFPAGIAMTAHVRAEIDGPILATLSTANGKLVRAGNRDLDITISGTDSVNWTAPSIILDIVRTDTTPDEYLGIVLTITTSKAVTRGL